MVNNKNELLKLSIESCAKAYDVYEEIGSTQYDFSPKYFDGELVQMLSIPGTNEFEDMFSNLNLCSKKGIKWGAYYAAQDIRNEIDIDPALKLYINGHSLGGATAISFQKQFGSDYCVAISPARCLRYWSNRNMKNTTMFIDPDDLVPNWLGRISFGNPKCGTKYGKKDHLLWSIGDHKMSHWLEYAKHNL